MLLRKLEEIKLFLEQVGRMPPTVSPTTFSGHSKGALRLKRVDPQALTQKGPLRPFGSHVSSPAVGKYKDTMDAFRQGGRSTRYASRRGSFPGRREETPYVTPDLKIAWKKEVRPELDVSRSRIPPRPPASYVRDKGETGKLARGPHAYRWSSPSTGRISSPPPPRASAKLAAATGAKLQQKRATSQAFINKVRAYRNKQIERKPASMKDRPLFRKRSQELGYKTLSRRRKED